MDRFDKIEYSHLSPESEWTRLGKGSFGCVYKGEYLGLEVAIKEVLPSGEYDMDKYFERECRIMAEARHPNVVQYIGLCLAPLPPPSNIFPDRPPVDLNARPRILIISEFLPRGNLRSYIADRSLPMPWRLRLSFLIDIARAIAYLHSRNCMHRDLKGENLLVTENERVKVCDFGFARITAQNEEERRRMSYCGTDGYMAPEVLMGDDLDLPVDVFSLGVIFVEVISRTLVDNRHFVRIMPSFGISTEEITSSISKGCPPALLSLTLACLAIEPADRPKVLDVLTSLRAIEVSLIAAEIVQERGTLNVGSVSFSGTIKRGTGKSTRARPGAPRLPSFDGQVKLVSSSLLQNGFKSKTSRPGGHGRGGGSSSESEDDSVDLLALAEAEVMIDKEQPPRERNITPGGESHTGLLDEDREAEGNAGSTYSTRVFRRGQPRPDQDDEQDPNGFSTLTVRAFPGGHDRLASTTSSLPSLPASWIDKPLDSSSSSDDSPPRTPAQDQDIFPHTSPSKVDTLASFLTARTTTLSIAGATISHAGSDDSDAGSSSDDDEINESRDVFHSTIRAPASFFDEDVVAGGAVHRFSLIKPTFQRFLGSLAPYSSASSVLPGLVDKRSSLEAKRSSSTEARSTVDLLRRTTAGGQQAPHDTTKCALCEKKLGVMKAFLECDDCGFRCHIKCSDVCTPHCAGVDPKSPAATLSRPSTSTSVSKTAPPSRPLPAQPSVGASKLIKKRPVTKDLH